MRLDEQRAAAQCREAVDDLPGLVLVAFRIGADERHRFVAQMRGGPDRAEFRMHEVCTAARMRGLAAGFRDRHQLAFLGVDHDELAASVRRRDEVAVRRVEPAIMQEAFGLDLGRLEVLEIGVVDHAGSCRSPSR